MTFFPALTALVQCGTLASIHNSRFFFYRNTQIAEGLLSGTMTLTKTEVYALSM